MFFYLPLGHIVDYPKLYSGVRIYNNNLRQESVETDNLLDYKEAKLNMVMFGMNFVNIFTEYIKTNYMSSLCRGRYVFPEFRIAYISCYSQGMETPGMPIIELILYGNMKFKFTSSDYFIYPTTKPMTGAVEGLFGIQVYNMM